jgi:hypothetical protein
MSDLHWSLIGLGAMVVAGVLLYNWWQEREHRRRAEQAFEAPPRDILLDPLTESRPEPGLAARGERGALADVPPLSVDVAEPPVPESVGEAISGDGIPFSSDETPGGSSEDWPETIVAQPHRIPEPAPEPAGLVTECEAVLLRETPFGEGFVRDVQEAIGALTPHPILEAFDDRTGTWAAVDGAVPHPCHRIRAVMGLADRQGAVHREQLEAFAAVLRHLAAAEVVSLSLPDLDVVEAQARTLDAFLYQVDGLVVLRVVARAGKRFLGTRIRALAESSGLKLRPDGQFHLEDAQGQSLFTLDNKGQEPFFPDSMRTLNTSEIAFNLDVPRSAGGIAGFDRMVHIAKLFATSLDAVLLTEGGREPQTDGDLEKVRVDVAKMYERMDSAGLPAGSAQMKRLLA